MKQKQKLQVAPSNRARARQFRVSTTRASLLEERRGRELIRAFLSRIHVPSEDDDAVL
jgi:hypothetical protein